MDFAGIHSGEPLPGPSPGPARWSGCRPVRGSVAGRGISFGNLQRAPPTKTRKPKGQRVDSLWATEASLRISVPGWCPKNHAMGVAQGVPSKKGGEMNKETRLKIPSFEHGPLWDRLGIPCTWFLD